MDTIYFLDELKARYNWRSDYRLAKELGISQARVSNYRTGKQNMDDSLCLQVEKLLSLPPGSILLQLQAERTKCPEAAQVLRQISEHLPSIAASVLLAFTMICATIAPHTATASPLIFHGDTVYYVKSCTLWIFTTWPGFATFCALFLANRLILGYFYNLLKISRSVGLAEKRSANHEK